MATPNTVSADCGTRHGRPNPPLLAPLRAEPIPGGYVVRDANGQALTYLYWRDNPTEALQDADQGQGATDRQSRSWADPTWPPELRARMEQVRHISHCPIQLSNRPS